MRVQEHTEKDQHSVAAVTVQILYEAIEQSSLQQLVVKTFKSISWSHKHDSLCVVN